MKYKEESTEDLLLNIFFLGVMMANDDHPPKYREKDLQKTFKELERRGIVKDGDECYRRTCV